MWWAFSTSLEVHSSSPCSTDNQLKSPSVPLAYFIPTHSTALHCVEVPVHTATITSRSPVLALNCSLFTCRPSVSYSQSACMLIGPSKMAQRQYGMMWHPESGAADDSRHVKGLGLCVSTCFVLVQLLRMKALRSGFLLS